MEDAAEIMLFGICILLSFAGCSRQEAAKQADREGNVLRTASSQFNNFTLSSITGDGVSNWQLEGETADMTQNEVSLNNIRIKSRMKGSSVTMAAKKGLIKKDTEVGIFQDDVVLSSDDGITLLTDKVEWFFREQTATTERPVVVKNGGLETCAKGASLSRGLNRISLNKEVSMKTASGAKIKCSGPLTMDYKKNIAVFNNDVSIESDSGKMSSRRMVVFFNPQKHAIRHIEASGDVRLARDGSVSNSQRAIYFAQEGRAVLLGSPSVYIDSKQAKTLKDKTS